ncbi:MAG: ArsR family transcriptional regulator [Chloroflexia bacterium]
MFANTLTTPAPGILKLLAHDLRWRALVALARSDYRVLELVKILDEPHNVVSYHLRRLRESHLVSERRSASDARDVYYSVDLMRVRDLYFATGESLHPAMRSDDGSLEPTEDANPSKEVEPARVLFLCTHNSARSQMAEALLRHMGGNGVEVASAGTEATRVHPDAIKAMSSLNIDISTQRSKHLSEFLGHDFDYIVTVCDRAKESCPVFPGDPERIHWSFPDPSAVEPEAARLQAFEKTARELMVRIRVLLSLIEHDKKRAK